MMACVVNDLYGQWLVWSMTSVLNDLYSQWPVWLITYMVDDLCSLYLTLCIIDHNGGLQMK